jgi:thiosulfate reductase cytochrome b subunit
MTFPTEKVVAFQFGFLLATFLLTFKIYNMSTSKSFIGDFKYVVDSVDKNKQTDEFSAWIEDLENREDQPKACNINHESCDDCGS